MLNKHHDGSLLPHIIRLVKVQAQTQHGDHGQPRPPPHIKTKHERSLTATIHRSGLREIRPKPRQLPGVVLSGINDKGDRQEEEEEIDG